MGEGQHSLPSLLCPPMRIVRTSAIAMLCSGMAMLQRGTMGFSSLKKRTVKLFCSAVYRLQRCTFTATASRLSLQRSALKGRGLA